VPTARCSYLAQPGGGVRGASPTPRSVLPWCCNMTSQPVQGTTRRRSDAGHLITHAECARPRTGPFLGARPFQMKGVNIGGREDPSLQLCPRRARSTIVSPVPKGNAVGTRHTTAASSSLHSADLSCRVPSPITSTTSLPAFAPSSASSHSPDEPSCCEPLFLGHIGFDLVCRSSATTGNRAVPQSPQKQSASASVSCLRPLGLLAGDHGVVRITCTPRGSCGNRSQ